MPVLLLMLAAQGCVMGDLAPGRAHIVVDSGNTPCFGLSQQDVANARDPRITSVVVRENRQLVWTFDLAANDARPIAGLGCIPFNTVKVDASGVPVPAPDPIPLENDVVYQVTVVARDPGHRGDASRLIGDARFCVTTTPHGIRHVPHLPDPGAVGCR